MKTKKIFLFIIIFVFMLCLSACSQSDNSNQKIQITIYDNETPTTFPVTKGEQAIVTSFTKNGYYLAGIFDSKEGGQMYFDSDGRSLGVWQKANPTVLYTQYKPISDISKTFDIIFSDNPTSYSWSTNMTWALEGELKNAVKGNLNKTLNITLSFRIKEGNSTIFNTNNHTNNITLKDSEGGGAEFFERKQVISTVSNYDLYTLTWNAPARCGRTGKIIIEFNRGNNFNEAWIRDLELSVSFV